MTMTLDDPLLPSGDALADLLRRSAQDEAPPAAARARVLALPEQLQPRTQPQLQESGGRVSALVRRLVAVAVPGGGMPGFAPALGVRGAAAAGREWLFKAEECEIDLRAQPRGERWTLAGQLFGAPQADTVVLEGGALPARCPIGPTREFGFGDVAAGRYRLTVQGGEIELVIARLDLDDLAA